LQIVCSSSPVKPSVVKLSWSAMASIFFTFSIACSVAAEN
jgi:hypothetical protein